METLMILYLDKWLKKINLVQWNLKELEYINATAQNLKETQIRHLSVMNTKKINWLERDWLSLYLLLSSLSTLSLEVSTFC